MRFEKKRISRVKIILSETKKKMISFINIVREQEKKGFKWFSLSRNRILKNGFKIDTLTIPKKSNLFIINS